MAKEKQNPVELLVSRFQLETEQKIAKIAADMGREHNDVLRKLAQLEDTVRECVTREADLIRKVDDAEANVRRGITDVTSALRQAVELAEAAKQSAQVYEKLQESQAPLLDRINEVAVEVAGCKDRIVELREAEQELRGAVDRARTQLHDVALEASSNTRVLESRHPLAAGLVQVG